MPSRSGKREYRRSSARSPKLSRPLVLIVCEGDKAERFYFDELRKRRRIPKQRIKILSSKECGGTDPRTLVRSAKKEKQKILRELGLEYDRVWCVFDRDEHKTFDAGVDQAKSNEFELAYSVPCFELWFLLHFVEQTAHIEKDQAKRKCRNIEKMREYEKHPKDMYEMLFEYQSTAMKNAKLLKKYHDENGNAAGSNPSTRVDELVAFLQTMKH